MTLRRANESEQRARDVLTFSAWGDRLTTDSFLEREQRLRGHPWARRCLETWLWVEGSEVLASCETFRDAARVGERSGDAFTIASVFTAPEHRGRGAARQLLEALLKELAARPDSLAVTLYSEIGPSLYARLGFQGIESFDQWWDAATFTPSKELQWLVDPLPDVRTVSAAPGVLVQTLSSERLDWHLERERFYGHALQRAHLRTHGARCGAATITWTAYWKTNELQILSLEAQRSEDGVELIQAARTVAHEAALSGVRWWETNASLDLSGTRRRRDDELPMVRGLGIPVRAWNEIHRGLWA